MVVGGQVDIPEFDFISGKFSPSVDASGNGLNRSQRFALQFKVDFPAGQIVHDDHIVSGL
jgi:hypothetical protein